ncbi:35954_t:CDS:2, partial [Racocetra persica]
FWLTIKGIDVGVASLGPNADLKSTATVNAILKNTTFNASKLQKAENVASSSGKPTVEITVPEDVNDVYKQALNAVRQPKVDDVSIATPQQRKEDSRKSFRTMVVLLWIFSNALLIIAVTYASDTSRTDKYMAIILWSVAGLAAFRFL